MSEEATQRGLDILTQERDTLKKENRALRAELEIAQRSSPFRPYAYAAVRKLIALVEEGGVSVKIREGLAEVKKELDEVSPLPGARR